MKVVVEDRKQSSKKCARVCLGVSVCLGVCVCWGQWFSDNPSAASLPEAVHTESTCSTARVTLWRHFLLQQRVCRCVLLHHHNAALCLPTTSTTLAILNSILLFYSCELRCEISGSEHVSLWIYVCACVQKYKVVQTSSALVYPAVIPQQRDSFYLRTCSAALTLAVLNAQRPPLHLRGWCGRRGEWIRVLGGANWRKSKCIYWWEKEVRMRDVENLDWVRISRLGRDKGSK